MKPNSKPLLAPKPETRAYQRVNFNKPPRLPSLGARVQGFWASSSWAFVDPWTHRRAGDATRLGL